MSSSLGVFPQIQKFGGGGVAVALIAVPLLPNFHTFGGPYGADDVALHARSHQPAAGLKWWGQTGTYLDLAHSHIVVEPTSM